MGKNKRQNADASVQEPTEKKSKGDESMVEEVGEVAYADKLAYASAIAHPMAGKKLCKKALKLVKKAHKVKGLYRSGLRDVQSRLRKGERGIVILAADVTPIDVMCHIPAVCEKLSVPYCYVPLRMDISNAMGVRRPTLMALIVNDDKNGEFATISDLYDEVKEGIKSLPPYQEQ